MGQSTMGDPKAKALCAKSTVPITATKMDVKYSHLLVRDHFDWCEDVENHIAAKTKSHAVPITATKPDERYQHLLVRKQFDWWEDVENDIAMTSKALAIATITKLDEKYKRLLVPERFDWGEDVENDIAMKDKALAMDKEIFNMSNGNPATNGLFTAENLDDDEAFHSTGGFKAPLGTNTNIFNNELLPTLKGTTTAVILDNVRTHLFSCKKSDSSDVKATLSIGYRPQRNNITQSSHEAVDSPHPISLPQSLELPCSTDLSNIITHPCSFAAPGPMITLPDLVKIPPINKYTQPVDLCHGLELPDFNDPRVGRDPTSHKLHTARRPNQWLELPSAIESPMAFGVPASVPTAELTEIPPVNNYTFTVDPCQGLELPVSTEIEQPPQITQSAEQLEPFGLGVCANEYEYRSIVGDGDKTIHHWNWFGQPVYSPTATPPAVSVAFIYRPSLRYHREVTSFV
ncbi:Major facilitator superfamily domain general substrate transporter [Penicillium concentricum]|uniref:Major facilitator superfamily domain general substrate transporter n=1 Tax=Penicillium concentricum TaxID=293559 RepID=A0A9W9RBQ6_9EURO|nr:Major facilitator superfamily domain general substrate transporter [Penicillium concentricum]KAJ5356369.1 Major facilitator superfamily domain general substrate transporter [Penicillium concentricum]